MTSKHINTNNVRTAFTAWRDAILEPLGLEESDTQFIECRRAFYAGCHAMLALISRESERFDDDERRAAMQVEAMHQEIVAFFKAVREGKA